MKFLFILFTCLLTISSISATPIDHSIHARDESFGLAAREDLSDAVRMKEIRIWTSRNNKRIQFRILGGIRIIHPFLDMFAESSLSLAKAFFADFIKKNPFAFGKKAEKVLALYRAGSNTDPGNGPVSGLIGMQWEWTGHDNDYMYDSFRKAIREYFKDNGNLPLVFKEVKDAFDEGGVLDIENGKRDLDGNELKPRADVCNNLDLVSLFWPKVYWDPNAKLQGAKMCEDIAAGPNKRETGNELEGQWEE